MKTERRHELQHNTLADSLGRGIEAIEPYSRTILGVMAAIALVIVSLVIISRRSQEKVVAGWDQYFRDLNQTNPSDALEITAKKYPDTAISVFARLDAADLKSNDGMNQVFVDKSTGRDLLEESIKDYDDALKQTSDPLLKQRGMFGLARAQEGLGEIEKAHEQYLALAKKWPDGPYSKIALQRSQDLRKDTTKQFFAWFDKQYPRPKMSGEPGTPGHKPDFLKDNLEGANSKLPSVLDDTNSLLPNLRLNKTEPAGDDAPLIPGTKPEGTPAPNGDEKPKEEKATEKSDPAGEKPAGGEGTKAPEGKSAAEKPASDKPASDKPASDKPVDEPPK